MFLKNFFTDVWIKIQNKWVAYKLRKQNSKFIY